VNVRQNIESILTSRNYPNFSSVVDIFENECRSRKIFTIPAVELPYDISSCFIDLSEQLIELNIPHSERNIVQECLIRAHSLQLFTSGGGTVDEFNSLLSERNPLVLGLLRERNKSRQICMEDEDNNPINCQIVGGDIQTEYTFLDAVYSTENVTAPIQQTVVDTTGVKAVEIVPVEEAVAVSVNGDTVVIDEPFEISDGQLVIDGVGVEIYPDEISDNLPNGAIVGKMSIQSVNQEIVYTISSTRNGKLLFVLPVDIPIVYHINAVTGNSQVENPWWGILAQ
jgi:hypothetical protein